MPVIGHSPLSAQILHTNNRWSDCSIVIHHTLTQEAWHQFVTEAALVTYIRPLASAKPLGSGHLELSALNWSTRIDAADAAWNDTFSHPDSTHWLIEGDFLPIPGLMLRVGATDRLDVGGYFTARPDANYGIAGLHLQYNLLNDAETAVAAAGRLSAATLYGPDDLDHSVVGLDFLVSKDVYVFSPYVGVSGYAAHGRETTSAVELDNETIFGVQGTVGVAVEISAVRLGTEVNLGRVPSYSFKVGLGL
jgi:hypothetical protein